jgi:hypothetical protein
MSWRRLSSTVEVYSEDTSYDCSWWGTLYRLSCYFRGRKWRNIKLNVVIVGLISFIKNILRYEDGVHGIVLIFFVALGLCSGIRISKNEKVLSWLFF